MSRRDAPPDCYGALYMRMLAFLFEGVRAGHEARISDGVQQALGRPATSFAGWAEREAGALRGEGAGVVRQRRCSRGIRR